MITYNIHSEVLKTIANRLILAQRKIWFNLPLPLSDSRNLNVYCVEYVVISELLAKYIMISCWHQIKQSSFKIRKLNFVGMKQLA